MEAIDIFKALGNETRLKILEFLKDQPRCVCELIPIINKSQPNVSHHIKILEDANLIFKNTRGKNTFIELKNKKIFKIIEETKRLCE